MDTSGPPDTPRLLTDQYELTMLRAYHEAGMEGTATFSLFFRHLPADRNLYLACGLDSALRFLESLPFSEEEREHLASRPEFDPAFARRLGELHFTGEVRALPEGTPVFPGEPLLEVTAPLPQAQIAESTVMNQVHLQTVLASKASRVKRAAGPEGRVVDFGLRRMHGSDAALKGARAFHVGGVDATSNVLAGRTWGVPVTGTMAHSFVQAHDTEVEAFRTFLDTYPETILLIDTYDTVEGARTVVELARERRSRGEELRIRGVRLDSGDLGELAREVRRILDEGGLEEVEIFASGGLDEGRIRELREAGAPIDGFGVGTRMGVSRDAPALDMAYKLTAYDGRGRLKLSSGKETLPGRKQVFRRSEGDRDVGDVIGRADEDGPGRPLLRTVMADGRRVGDGAAWDPDAARERAARALERLPARVTGLDPADPPYPVEVSDALAAERDAVVERIRSAAAASRPG